jgi:hypothetical protein
MKQMFPVSATAANADKASENQIEQCRCVQNNSYSDNTDATAALARTMVSQNTAISNNTDAISAEP